MHCICGLSGAWVHILSFLFGFSFLIKNDLEDERK
jgi:hypothetical protein